MSKPVDGKRIRDKRFRRGVVDVGAVTRFCSVGDDLLSVSGVLGAARQRNIARTDRQFVFCGVAYMNGHPDRAAGDLAVRSCRPAAKTAADVRRRARSGSPSV